MPNEITATGTTGGNNAGGTPQASALDQNPAMTMHKFRVPIFNESNPTLFFNTTEYILTTNGITNEKEKFASLLQVLDPKYAELLHGIITGTYEDPYTRARQILETRFGESSEQKLNGTRYEPGTKPSRILQSVRNLAGPTAPDDLIKAAWMKNLPLNTRTILAAARKADLNELAEIADSIHSAGVEAVTTPEVSAVQSGPTTDLLVNMMNALTSLTREVASIKAREPRSRSRERRSPSERRYRPRSPSKNRHTKIINNLCWYHFKFDNDAHRCVRGCKYFETHSGNEK
jgi:hypothetical protein